MFFVMLKPGQTSVWQHAFCLPEPYLSHRPLIRNLHSQNTHTDSRKENMRRDSQLTELMIQYGNRFRSTDADLNAHLNEAERLFKENRYKRALDVAKDAIESVEPGSAAKIEKQFDNN